MADERCIDCAHFHRGYRLQGMRVPDFCNRHSPSGLPLDFKIA